MSSDLSVYKDWLVRLLSDLDISREIPYVLPTDYLVDHFTRSYLRLLTTDWSKASEFQKVSRLNKCPGNALRHCLRDYFVGEDMGCPLESFEIRLDLISQYDMIKMTLEMPPRKSLWRVFGCYWKTTDIWNTIDLACDLTLLMELSDDTLDFMYRYPVRFPCYHHAVPADIIIHPRYEDAVIGLIMAIIAGIIGGVTTVEYQIWRENRNQKLKELERALSLLLLESELRYAITKIRLREIEEEIEKSRVSLRETYKYFHKFHRSQYRFLKLVESLRAQAKQEGSIPEEIAKLKEEQDKLARKTLEKIYQIWDH
jgi:hypothetical protein